MDTLQNHEKPLTIREKLAIRLVLVLLTIVKPMNSGYDLDGHIKEFKALLDAPINNS